MGSSAQPIPHQGFFIFRRRSWEEVLEPVLKMRGPVAALHWASLTRQSELEKLYLVLRVRDPLEVTWPLQPFDNPYPHTGAGGT